MYQPTSPTSRNTKSRAACAFASLAIFLVVASSLTARDPAPIVTYLPRTTLVEGDQPLAINNTLAIVSPANVVSGQSVTITPVITLLSAPAGADPTDALSFITLDPATLVFTAPNQTLTTTIQMKVPVGKMAGDYAYQIATPGWAAGTVDNFGFVNLTVSAAQQDQAPPSLVLDGPTDGSTYTYTAGGPAISIPLQFHATAAAAAPLTQLSADVNGVALTLSTVGLGTTNASGAGTISLAAPGIYTVSARATNVVGTSLATAEITVNLVTPPTVTIAQPAPGGTYVYVTSAPPLAVPFSFSAASAGGGISALSATLNGTPVTVAASGLGTLNATGTGSLAVSAAGTYTFTATATTPNGTTSATRTFTVTVQSPAVTVTISKPANGAVFQIKPCCGDVLSIPLAFAAAAAGSGKISALSATLNGSTVAVKCSGLGTASATGTGTLRVTAAGTYTLAATAVSGGVSTVSKAVFTVQETVPSLLWLPPISLGKVQNGGSTVPIKFQLQFAATSDGCDHNWNRDDDDDHGCCGGSQNGNDDDHHGNCDDDDDGTINDTSVKIAIYEILANGGSSAVQVFTYGCRPNSSSYSIDDDGHYQLNFPTAKQGTHQYHIDVYRFAAGSTTPQLLGTKEFLTR